MAKGNIFVDRKVMAVSISILIALIGFISLKTLSIEQYPDIAPPTVQVTTSYTGADANTVMKSVVMPLEEAINGVENMAYITSEASATGDVTINVYFKQGTNADMAAVNVQNRVSKTLGLLPSEVTRVGVNVEKRQNSILQMTALVSRDGKFDQEFIANYIDINVKPRLQRIQGVGGVQNLGNTYSLRIWMKPDVMARYGLTPEDVFAAIGKQNLVAATGSLGEQSENTYQYTMEYKGRLTTIEEFQGIVLRAKKGTVLHLSDVADVELGSLSYSFSSRVDEQPGVVFIINQASGANATAVNAAISQLYKDMENQLPAGMEFTTLLTSDDFLYAAIHNVVETLIIAILLVILVVYFFLQSFKATIIPSISIIVSLLGTFAIVKIAGFSLNILTLFALVLAIGTVVDDAIVVVEAVMAKLENGYESAYQATRDAMSEVTVAVISCTLVFMAVFIPVTFMPGTSGTFFTQFGITIASSVGLSCISALTLCPALCVIMMRPNKEENKKNLNYYVKLAYNTSYNAILGKYQKGVIRLLRRPHMAWIFLVIAGGMMFWLMKTLPSGLVPQEDQGVILVDVSAPAGSTLHETDEIMAQVEQRVLQIPEVESYGKISGFGIVSGTGVSYGTLIVRLKNWDERKDLQSYIDYVIARLFYACEDIKEARVMPFQMPQIPGYGNANGIELVLEDLQGGSMSEFNMHANNFLNELQKRKEVQLAMSTYSESFPKYKVDVNATQCERAGISPDVVLSTLGAYCGGSYIGNYNQYGKVYRVMASAAPQYRLDPSSLENIYIRVEDKMAPIAQFVTLQETVGSASQKRFNLYQSITCQVNPAAGYAAGEVQNVIAEVAKDYLPSGYSYEYSGMSRELEANSRSHMTGLIYMICVLLIYLILACLYESWFIPWAVLLSVPFGLMGSFLFSKVCGQENNIYLQTGVIMLIGLLAKTAILITEFAVEKRKQGMDIVEAAYKACEDRLRPILMTVATMIIGMIPLIVEGGAGANGNRALAIGVVGGMSIGTIALLFVVPAFYIIFQRLHERFQSTESSKPNHLPVACAVILIAMTMNSCGIFKKYTHEVQEPNNLFGTQIEVNPADSNSIAQLTWREFFTDPKLQNLIDSALANNVDLCSARARIEIADINLRTAKLGFLPTIGIQSANAGISGTWSPNTSITGPNPLYHVPLALNWGGEGFGSITNRKWQAAMAQEKAQYEAAQIQANLISTIAQAYARLQLLDYQYICLNKYIQISQEVIQTQRLLYNSGKAYLPAVQQMESSLIQLQVRTLDLEQTVREVEAQICLLLCEPPHPIERNDWDTFTLPETLSTGVPAQMLSMRADVRAAEMAIAIAYYNINLAKAAFCPALSLSGLIGWTNNGALVPNPGQLLMNAVVGLTQPIFAGGKLRGNLKIAQINQEETIDNYVLTMLRAGNEVNVALSTCQKAAEKEIMYSQLRDTVSSAYQGTINLMQNGKAQYLEVLTAQQSLIDAELNSIENRYSGIIAKIQLYQALGGAVK